ncbi:MAG TPA: peptidase S8 family protein [Erythrobacter sp.]|nr:peptidase S8 family protein [Erythrobacter sp.]
MADFDKPHIDISARAIRRDYQAARRNMGAGSAPRIRAEHGAMIRGQMDAAFAGADLIRPQDERLEAPNGVFLEVDLRPGTNPEKTLERRRLDVRPGAVRTTEDNETRVALYVPDEARPVLQQIIDEYTTGDQNAGGQQKDRVEPINAMRQARLETFWTDDPAALPQGAQNVIWWEAWCFRGMEGKVREAAERIGAIVAEDHYWLKFPESTVLPIRSSRVSMELLLFATAGISELRGASASPVFFIESDYEDQTEWTEDLAERVVWPASDASAVCLMDTGVNRGHSLLEPAVSTDDLLSVRPDWGGDDHHGHGTWMAGLALLGDLTPRLQDQSEIQLSHRVESVKILPPGDFEANDPKSYGPVIQSAVARAEINKPERKRTFCLAVTNDNVSGSRATTWSAAIDQASVGKMPGDDNDAPARLFIVSAGNAPAEIDMDKILSADNLPIEDPAQAWNALTVGGYTNKSDIDDDGYDGWSAMAKPGELSPFTRTSVTWPQGRTAFKPDVVMEAGNRAISPSGKEALNLDSLGLLTTGENVAAQPLVPFSATSAAAAQCARLATQLTAAYPEHWPETIRALIVHSAEWTPWMLQELESQVGMTARYPLLRRFGHGVPSFERALASAQNHLALIAQREITPFKVQNGQKRFSDCHFYKLPWPKDLLAEIGEHDVRLKLTLSYFVEPNPGRFASIDAQRYQSFGLRFDLKRRLESEDDFVKRTNPFERDDPLGPGPDGGDNAGWRFGPGSVSAGSLHCDEWIGSAASLAARDIICVKPVVGWWRDSAANCKRKGRYALVATLSAPELDIDLHTPISTAVENAVGIEIPF